MDNRREIADYVCKRVSEYFNISHCDIYKRNKARDVATARGYIFYILHNKGLSANFIACEFKRTSRAVFYSLAVMKRSIRLYKDYAKEYENICKLIEN